MNDSDWLNEVKFSKQGLIPAIAQDANTHRVLMVAWMNKESLTVSVSSGVAVYWA